MESYGNLVPLAIVGIGLRFPKADNPRAFWNILKNAESAIVNCPAERWSMDEFYHADPAVPGKMINRKGGYLSNIDQFDWRTLRIPFREACHLDPQHRLLLEVTWEALED